MDSDKRRRSVPQLLAMSDDAQERRKLHKYKDNLLGAWFADTEESKKKRITARLTKVFRLFSADGVFEGGE
jgi:hypothetical protein